MFRAFAGLIVVFFLVAGAGAIAHAKHRAPLRAVTVTAVIFSGRPDPKWKLSQAQTAELRKRLVALPRMSEIPTDAQWPGRDLGHLRVRIPDPGWPDDVVTVDRGRVLWQSRKVLLFLDDTGRKLEGWLKGTSPPGSLPEGAFDR